MLNVGLGSVLFQDFPGFLKYVEIQQEVNHFRIYGLRTLLTAFQHMFLHPDIIH